MKTSKTKWKIMFAVTSQLFAKWCEVYFKKEIFAVHIYSEECWLAPLKQSWNFKQQFKSRSTSTVWRCGGGGASRANFFQKRNKKKAVKNPDLALLPADADVDTPPHYARHFHS